MYVYMYMNMYCVYFPFTIILAILQLKPEERRSVVGNFTSVEVEHGTG